MGEREQEARDVGPRVGLRVGVVDDDVLLAGGDAEREPHVTPLPGGPVEAGLAQPLADLWCVAPDHLGRQLEGVEPPGDRRDGVGAGPERDDDPCRVDAFERREHPFGREAGVFSLGEGDDDRGAIGRRVRHPVGKGVERRHALLDVFHRTLVRTGQEKAPRYERGRSA